MNTELNALPSNNRDSILLVVASPDDVSLGRVKTMFTFSDSDYDWCSDCSGNIRKGSAWCRYCKKRVEEVDFEARQRSAQLNIGYAARWLPSFDKLIENVPEIRKRVQDSDAAIPAPAIGVPDGLDAEQYRLASRNDGQIWPDFPEPAVNGFVWDVLLALHANGVNIREICEHPKLQMLEITPQEILAEYELRQSEIQNGERCRYCSEYILASSKEACRYCEGFEDVCPKPAPYVWDKPTDLSFLRAVLLHVAARRTIDGGEPLDAEILSAHNIDSQAIDTEVLKLRTNPDSVPLTRWLRRMMEFELKTMYEYQTMELSDLVELSSSLKSDKQTVKLIVLEHALARGADCCDDAQHQLGRVYDGLSGIYRDREDYAKAKEYKDLSDACQTFGMDEETKAIMMQMRHDTSSMFNFSDDPEEKLANFDKQLERLEEFSAQMTSKMDGLIPGLGTALAEALANAASSVSLNLDPTKARLEGDVARKSGDFETALIKFELAASLVKDTDLFGTLAKAGALRNVAEVLVLLNRLPEAEEKFKEAIAVSEAFCISDPDSQAAALSCSPHRGYANFLRDSERFEEAEREYQLAMKYGVKASAEYELWGAKGKCVGPDEWECWANYAIMLEKLGQTDKAFEFRTKAETARLEDTERKEKHQEKLRREREAGL